MGYRAQLRGLISALEARHDGLTDESAAFGQDMTALLRRCESF